MNKSLRIACDGEAASGKSTGAKLVSKKYKNMMPKINPTWSQGRVPTWSQNRQR